MVEPRAVRFVTGPCPVFPIRPTRGLRQFFSRWDPHFDQLFFTFTFDLRQSNLFAQTRPRPPVGRCGLGKRSLRPALGSNDTLVLVSGRSGRNAAAQQLLMPGGRDQLGSGPTPPRCRGRSRFVAGIIFTDEPMVMMPAR